MPHIPAPLAIVGIGCRLPGEVDSADALFDALLAKRSTITEVPPDRWDANAFYHPDHRRSGSIHARFGSFIDDIDRFDAGFFGISPNEAKRMDPQQRIILEVGYRAIENAGLRLDQLAGRDVAVFIGVSSHDYEGIHAAPTERANIGPTSNPGVTTSIIANRLSYVFDLRGPSVALDTACSSALTALHHASQSIWSGVAEAAIVGGVNLLIRPELTMGFSKGGYLSPDGACRAFSADANGYVRGEGAGAVFIRPLSAALADGNRILAVLRSTWINQDGHSLGMTMPRREAQASMLRAAYARADVDPGQAVYIEAHGTGTQAGDPIEAGAIGDVLGRARDSGELFVGSVKTNIGHLESAAGIAGLIKLIEVLRRRQIPPNLHFSAPNPAIDFEGLHLRVPTRAIDIDAELGRAGETLVGGVNSFGFGGANAHAVLESLPPTKNRSTVAVPPAPRHDRGSSSPLFLSARSIQALRDDAKQLAEHITAATDDDALDALAANLYRHRSTFEFRLGVAAGGRRPVAAMLARFATEGPESAASSAGLAYGRVPEGRAPTPVTFVFSGQGPQWWAMGRRLLATEPVFRTTVEAVDRELAALGWLADDRSSLLTELRKDQAHSRMAETRVAQPAIYALQLGLARVLEARGVRPAAVMGHSIGELAAAVCAGALTMAEGARLVYWRSTCQAQAEGAGRMAALGLSAEATRARLAPYAAEIELAAINGPAAVTVAGSSAAIDRLYAELEAEEIFCRVLAVSVPFHCYLMDPIEAEFRAGVGEVETRSTTVPFISTVTGSEQPADALDVSYWYRNIREPVRYLEGFETLIDRGSRCFVEIGPHPILARGSLAALEKAGVEGTYLASLRRVGDDEEQLAPTLAGLFAAGAPCVPMAPLRAQPRVELPPYPFERQRYWLESEASRALRVRPSPSSHPHRGAIEPSPKTPECFRCTLTLDPRTQPYLSEHRIQGDLLVFPGAGQLELVLAAAREAFPEGEAFVEDLSFERPVVLDASGEGARLGLEVYSDDGHFTVSSQGADAHEPWTVHTRGRINHCGDRFGHGRGPSPTRASILAAREGSSIEVEGLYRAAASAGLDLGPSFRGIRGFWPGAGQTVAEIHAPAGIADEHAHFLIHPAVLDCMLQSAAMGELYTPDERARRLFLPRGIASAQIHRPFTGGELWSHAALIERSAEHLVFDVEAVDADGQPVVSLYGLRLAYIKGSQRGAADERYIERWRPLEPRDGHRDTEPPRPTDRRGQLWLVLDGTDEGRLDGQLGARIRRRLDELGAQVVALRPGDGEGDFKAVLAGLDPARRVAGVVHGWALGALDEPAADRRDALVEARGPVALGQLLGAIDETERWAETPAVWMLSAGVARGEDADECPDESVAAAQLWGFGRVLMAERPGLRPTLLDLPVRPSAAELDAAVACIVAEPRGHELAVRDGRPLALHLEPLEPNAGRRKAVEVELATQAVAAWVATPGVIASTRWRARALPPLGPDEVELEVRATSLNFKDVAVAMGMLGEEAWEGGASGAELGLDCTGVVRAVGDQDGRWSVGDEVVGVAAGSLANRIVVPAAYLTTKPTELDWAQAVALPSVFGTACLALEHLARLAPGETVLIHAGAGGVGSAAIRIAQRIGARVIATTSTEEKRAYLRSLGVKDILPSRTPTFRQAILEWTDGRGVDVVLNSLTGRSMTQSIHALAPFGRFIEIGKADIYADRQLGLRTFGENRSFHVLDFNRWLAGRTTATMEVIDRCVRQVAAGELTLPPIRRFPAAEAAEALQHLARGKHIGKVVVEMPPSGRLEAAPGARVDLHDPRTYVITGGVRGFGLAVARWLVERGAARLALVSRGGLPGEDERRIVEDLRTHAQVRVIRGDVGEREDLAAILTALREETGLAGIFHAAAVLDDAPIEALDPTRYRTVLRAKVDGARNLHELTISDDLRCFVLFSSIASILGSPGQANYAAANAYLDQLAVHRRAIGLPATAINFGVIDEVGMVARASAIRRRRILGQGIAAFSAAQALGIIEEALLEDDPRVIAAAIDWRHLAELGGVSGRPGRFAGFAEGSRGDARQALARLPADERAAALTEALAAFLATLVGQDAEELDRDASTDRLGLDSLVGAQLQSWIEVRVGVVVPLVRLLRGQTLRELATELAGQMTPQTGDSGPKQPVAAPAEPAGSEPSTGLWRSHRDKRSPEPRARLVCLPYMGADDEAYASWVHELDPTVELVSAHLPTLDAAEPSAALVRGPLPELRAALVDSLVPLLDRPFVLYGHSMGAWMAIDLAAALQERDLPTPRLVVLGAPPPATTMTAMIPADLRTREDLDHTHVRAALARMETRPEVWEEPTLVARVRRDLWLGHLRRFEHPLADSCASLSAPTLLVVGQTDALAVTPESWPGRVARVDGGHLFIHEPAGRAALLEQLRPYLE